MFLYVENYHIIRNCYTLAKNCTFTKIGKQKMIKIRTWNILQTNTHAYTPRLLVLQIQSRVHEQVHTLSFQLIQTSRRQFRYSNTDSDSQDFFPLEISTLPLLIEHFHVQLKIEMMLSKISSLAIITRMSFKTSSKLKHGENNFIIKQWPTNLTFTFAFTG